MLDSLDLSFDPSWFSKRQYEHLLNALNAEDGPARVKSYYEAVQARVDSWRNQQLTSGQIVYNVMAQAAGGHPGIEESDLIPITRGLLSVILEEKL
jgi:hypothetical protein